MRTASPVVAENFGARQSASPTVFLTSRTLHVALTFYLLTARVISEQTFPLSLKIVMTILLSFTMNFVPILCNAW